MLEGRESATPNSWGAETLYFGASNGPRSRGVYGVGSAEGNDDGGVGGGVDSGDEGG